MRGEEMKKTSFLVIGLLLMSIVVMSGCADKTSDNTAPAEENSKNLSANNTMPQGGEHPGNMPSNETMPPAGGTNEMPANGTMPPGGPGNNSTMPPGGTPPSGNPGEMPNSTTENQ